MYNHNFHLVNNSPWPLLSSFSGLIFFMSFISLISGNCYYFFFSMIILILLMYQWWRDIIREGLFQGIHSNSVNLILKTGMVLFIVSEVFFFISFFWGFFHLSLSQSLELGMVWPPVGIKSLEPLSIPLLNTIILLVSGISISWSHFSMLINDFKGFFSGLLVTIFLGIYFLFIQFMEYSDVMFNISDSSYGSIFFMLTGFHGLHVIIGVMFLSVCFIRGLFAHFSMNSFLGFEMSIWYWHFVDLVWLFVYVILYWWGA